MVIVNHIISQLQNHECLLFIIGWKYLVYIKLADILPIIKMVQRPSIIQRRFSVDGGGHGNQRGH